LEVRQVSVGYEQRSAPAGGRYEDEETARGWLVFASVMLGLAGIFNIIDGIVALSKSKFFVQDATYVFSDLRTWGWIVLVLGIVQMLAAFAVVNRSQWARWFGIGVAGVNAIAQLVWVPAYPFWSLTMFAVDILVIYGLAVYGSRKGFAG
jgi:hypothetical protein